MKTANFVIGTFGLILLAAAAGLAYAQEEALEENAYTLETVSGEVSGIGKDFISIVYDRDYDTGTEYEIMIPIEQNTTLKHKKNLAEIKAGDLVSVEFEKPVEGSKEKAKARMINFIQSGIDTLAAKPAQ